MINEENNLNEMLILRRQKLKELREQGKDPFVNEKYNVTHKSQDIKDNYDELEEKEVSIAGRIMSKRGQGKVSFSDMQDSQGRIQLFVKMDNIGTESYDLFKTYDIGDIVGVVGTVFKTKTGEVSVRVKEITLLTKSLQILPEKFHGLKDPDLRYRQRYVDLIVNPEVKETFIKRNKIIKSIRSFLDDRGYLEVETPILTTIAGGAAAKPFLTHHNTLDIDMQLRIANELYLKRLIVGGFDKVYEMGKMFRNEGISIKHNPEFTNIELYSAYEDYEDMMDITENIIAYCAEELYGTTLINYQGKEIDFKVPWKRVSMHDLVKEKTNVDFYSIESDEEARKIAKEQLKLEVTNNMTRGHLVNLAFEEFCESDLVQPTFVLHHPVEVSPLAKRNPDNPMITNRFEAFANGWELANAFSELNDPIDQKGRFEEQLKQREAGDEEAHPMDEDFINALEVGLPPTGGLGIGVDRMIMILTNSASIRDIILFPTMKPINK
ncbi:lysyl-tRNA ligase LysS [Gottschalkia acidurici 9a]|uniref:Lysine--tRNA ligase n=1 Tax=Gottschalkia acidurici (strain ATCC 7906 / DSM 604 / BCRC 14475 / CIP 104303 / KCTC 5404 / NCIMB 10678 / 9a) TaxID=1128398 RepID=K0B3A9_GOTA9|nr:lysine--tRNA ligase [Gottschalkia acidurici]AFS79355.1 lysyl-tRNA ligase LysS [Gottschalkia acidurici 9a]